MRIRTMVAGVTASIILTSCATTPPSRDSKTYDLIIRGGRIVDGTGAPWYRADIAITGDTLVEIGQLGNARAKATIDANDQIVSPGFIDLLGWSHDSALIDPNLEGKIRQGVTTEATGEGHSPAPNKRERVEESAPSTNNREEFRETLASYMKEIEKRGSALNFAFFVGSSNPRSMVIGAINRDPSEDEMRQMENIVDQAMREGAIGLSTSLIYIPAVFSKTEEIVRLAAVAARHGGVYFTHLRDEGDRIDSALDEAFRIGREAKIPVNIWHLKAAGRKNWGRMPAIVEKIEAARSTGIDVAANIYPYAASSTSLSTILSDWALEGGYAALLERFRDPATREKIKLETLARFEQRGRLPGDILVSRIGNDALAQYQRKKLDEIASMMNVEPVEAALRLLEQSTASPQAIFFSMNEDDMRHALVKPWVSVGADSGAVVGNGRSQGAHPRAYGTFPRVVGRYVREDKLLTLEEAVRKVTSQAAGRINLQDRGILRIGMKADVVVFDPETLNDVSTYDDPHHFSVGISNVVVNGKLVLHDGKMTGAHPGRVLRGPGWVK